jgi:hypothetical protein
MHDKGETIDLVTVLHRAQQANLAWVRDGAGALAGMTNEVPSVHSLPTFLEDLKDQQHRRLAVEASRRLAKAAADPSAPAHQLLEDSEAAFQHLRRSSAPVRLSVLSAGELVEAQVPEDDNLLGDRLLARGQSLTILGAGGLGKSRLLLQLAACSITGRPFIGLRTHAAGKKWLVFQAENSKRRLRDDLQRLREWLGEDWEQVSQRLFIHTVQTTHDAFLQLDIPEFASGWPM